MYFLLPILRGILAACLVTNNKYLLSIKKLDSHYMAYITRSVTVVLLLLPLYYLDQYHYLLNLKFLTYTLANTTGEIFLIILFYYSLRRFDASYLAVIKSIQPAVFAIVSFFILGETISNMVMFGIAFIILGTLCAEKSRLKGNKFNFKNSAWPIAIISMLVAAVITNFSKMAVLEADPLIYLWLRSVILVIVFYTVFSIKSKKFSKKYVPEIEDISSKTTVLTLISGILILATTVCQMYALKYLPVATVDALTRVDLIALLILEYFFITKSINIYRIIAVILVLIGIIIIILG